MSVRAKVKVESVTYSQHWQDRSRLVGSVVLRPVTGDSPENKKFYEATPGGEFKLSTINEAALKFFEIGKEFYVDFTPAAPPEAA